MKAYSLDLRQKIIEAYNHQEGSLRQLAKRFKVSLSFVQKLVKRYREQGTVESLPGGKGFEAFLAQNDNLVRQLVEQDNDATLGELREKIYQQTGVDVSQSYVVPISAKTELNTKKNFTRSSS